MADHPLDDLRRLGMGRDAIQAKACPVEDTEAEGMRQALQGAEADVDAPSSEAPPAPGLGGVGGILEPDQVGLRLVKCDDEVASL